MPLQPMITGARHMISAGHYLATEAGHAVLEAGGNAVDAGVAAGIALGVVHSDQVQCSGVAPMIIYLAERDEAVVISGLGGWPRAARLETFLGEHGGVIPLGILRTVVPAAPDAWILALERYGTMSFGDVAGAAIRYAREGFTMHPVMAHYIAKNAETYRRWPDNAAIYLPQGRPPREGELFVQADLARSLQFMVDEERAASRGGRIAGLRAARDAFYRGDLAAAMVRYHAEHGGWLTARDLEDYHSEIERPLSTCFRGVEVLSCGPWCQGPVLLQMLSLLADDDLAALGHNTPAYVHLVAEAMKLCFADRERYYGDPRFVHVPMDALLAPSYAAERRRLVRPETAWAEMPPAGDVAGLRPRRPLGRSDRRRRRRSPRRVPRCLETPPMSLSSTGTAMPCPRRRATSRGRARLSPASASVPRRAGRSPGPCPAIPRAWRPASGRGSRRIRRWRSRRGRWVMPFGGPGGDLQPQAMLQVFLNHTVFGMSVQEAVEAPALRHAQLPGQLRTASVSPGPARPRAGNRGQRGQDARGQRPPSRVAPRSLHRDSRRLRDRRRPRARRAVRRSRPAPSRPRHGLVNRAHGRPAGC